MSNDWYAEGLRFACTECGKCCSGPPGYVWITEEECQKIAEHLGLKLEEFLQKYVRLVGHRLSLIEVKRGQNYDCIFLEGKRCKVYEARPKQCQTFPWWPQNLKDKKSWESVAKTCEGINEQAPLVPLVQVRRQLLQE